MYWTLSDSEGRSQTEQEKFSKKDTISKNEDVKVSVCDMGSVGFTGPYPVSNGLYVSITISELRIFKIWAEWNLNLIHTN